MATARTSEPAVWLGATGAVYLGFALNDGREKAFPTEVAGISHILIRFL